MSGRQIFSESEKLCLQELIIKYKLNLGSTIAAGNPNVKKLDNLKSRKKTLLAQEKKERMRTGGGSFNPKPGPSKQDPMLVDEALIESTDVELKYVIDSDNLPTDTPQETSHQNDPLSSETVPQCVLDPQSQLHTVIEMDSGPELERGNHGQSRSRHTDYSTSGQQTSGTAKNIRAKVIDEEFRIRKHNYERTQEREEELHRLIMEEKQWMLKAAKEIFKRAEIERKNAEEILRFNQAKREETELFKK